MNAIRAVTPDSTSVVAIHITAIEEDGIAAFSVLCVNPISGACNQAGAFDKCDTSSVRVDGEVSLPICVQFSTRDLAESCFWEKDNLGEWFCSGPRNFEWETELG